MSHLITGFLLLALATVAQAAAAADGNSPPVVHVIDDPAILFFSLPLVIAFKFTIMILAVLGCGLAKKRPGAFDISLEGAACGCCGTSSMAQIRRLCIAVAYFSMTSWYSIFARQWLWPVYLVSLGTLLLSLRLCYAAWQSNFVDSSTWVATPTYSKVFRACGVIYVIAMVIAAVEGHGMAAETKCDTQKYGATDCDFIKNFYGARVFGAVFEMSILAGLTVALAYALEDFAVRVQQVTTGGRDLETGTMFDTLPPLAQVYQAASSNAPPVHMPTAKQEALLTRDPLQI